MLINANQNKTKIRPKSESKSAHGGGPGPFRLDSKKHRAAFVCYIAAIVTEIEIVIHVLRIDSAGGQGF